VTKLNLRMLDRHTSPAIGMAVIQNLRWWKCQLAPKTAALSNALGKALASDKTRIGWYNLVMGRLSNCWAPLQHKYFQPLGKRTTGCSWAISLIVQLWQLSWNQWAHQNNIYKNTMHPEKQYSIEDSE
jgi:hypothetical protein